MLLSELLGLSVLDDEGRRVGTVIDVRLAVQVGHQDDAGPTQLFGFVVSPHSRSSYLGYERTDSTGPAMLSAILRWRHRGAFLAAWEDIARIEAHSVTLRSGHHRYSARLVDHH
jgi:hypothetical protein